MKIPNYYYQDFWVTNSLLSAGTGFVLGIMSTVIPLYLLFGISRGTQLLTFFVVFTLIYQGVFFSFFKGKRRGAFEYSYFEKALSKHQR